ncbi:MAG TPA: glutathione peroxidase [bacterium]|jgi:glutathione peroxidase|nr:glutathione peroxidase [bacterium]
MGKLFSLFLGILFLLFSALLPVRADEPQTGTVYPFKMKDIDGGSVPLSKYKGKVLLIVNVASKCGHTPQYAGLEKLYEKYKDKGFVILGFPCNQFMHQEPGTDAEIKTFCTTKYNVTFPMFDKIEVNGDNANPLYQFLKKAEPDPKGNLDIGWNFTKFLIDRQGHPVTRIVTNIEPEQFDSEIQAAVSK